MTKTIKASATDKVVYTALNHVDDMPVRVTVMAFIDGESGFVECFRTVDVENGNREIFWLDNECREVGKSEIIGWVHYPEYEAE